MHCLQENSQKLRLLFMNNGWTVVVTAQVSLKRSSKKKKSKTQTQNSKHVSKPCLKIRILKLKIYFSPVNVCSRAHISKSFLQILILIIYLKFVYFIETGNFLLKVRQIKIKISWNSIVRSINNIKNKIKFINNNKNKINNKINWQN